MISALKKLTTTPTNRYQSPDAESKLDPIDQDQQRSAQANTGPSSSGYPGDSDDILSHEMTFNYSFSSGSNWYSHKSRDYDTPQTNSVNQVLLDSPPNDAMAPLFDDHSTKRRRKSHITAMDRPSPINFNAPHHNPAMMPLTPPEIKSSFPGKFSIHKKPSFGYLTNKKVSHGHGTLHPPVPHYDACRVSPSSPAKIQRAKKPGVIPLPVVVDEQNRGPCETTDGHYDYSLGEKFADRYTIIKLLGQGTFGRVFQVFDDRTQRYYALKVIKSIHKYREASKIELRVLVMLNQCDPYATNNCVKVRGCFDYRNHVCILTDLYDISVYDFLKSNEFMGFPTSNVRSFAHQLLKSVAFLHSVGLIHTDLKPENVLLTSSKFGHGLYRKPRTSTTRTRKELINTDIKIIDFGSAVFSDEYHPEVISTRHYRAPEVVLGTGWSYPCDIWSVGCLLVELFTGKVLFETRDDLEHLYLMETISQSKFSYSQLSSAAMKLPGANLVNVSPDGMTLAQLSSKSKSLVDRAIPLAQSVKKAVPVKSDDPYWVNFFDLVSRMLVLDANDRITAADALNHPFFSSNSISL